MNFFESQDRARRNTGKLILLFALAVVSLIVVANFLILFILGMFSTMPGPAFDWNMFFLISAGVVAIVLLGSVYKTASLSGGGARVAEMLNGRLILRSSDDPDERRVLNVVEEMALASGTPVPPVYLLDEPGINAFAAGYTPGDAVIGITRGAIRTLSRDQLQGVIAHEFSHILHGDMRINIRLIGVLYGILILGILGYYLMRGSAFSRRSRESGGVIAVGLGLVVVGYLGTFFGNLIKAAVSRQREYLADASAVQYTRNPDGIAGALMRIATHTEHSFMRNPASMEISHALFEEGMASRLGRLYATHPPIEERIKAILPQWDGTFPPPQAIPSEAETTGDVDEHIESRESKQQKMMAGILTGAAGVLITDSMFDQMGTPDAAKLDMAHDILASIPIALLDAVHTPSSARAVIYILVLDRDPAMATRQLQFLEQSAQPGLFPEIQRIHQYRDQIPADARIALVSLALSSLRQLSVQQYELFRRNFERLVRMDKKIDLFEWSLQKILFKNLDTVFGKQPPAPLGKRDISRCRDAIAVLLSILAIADRHSKVDPKTAFARGQEKLDGQEAAFVEKSDISFEKLDAAMDELAKLKPLQKPALLKACVACISADSRVAPIEAELLRAVGAVLDCPIPPLSISRAV